MQKRKKIRTLGEKEKYKNLGILEQENFSKPMSAAKIPLKE